MEKYSGNIESGEISIIEEQDQPRQISTAIFSRWESKKLIRIMPFIDITPMGIVETAKFIRSELLTLEF